MNKELKKVLVIGGAGYVGSALVPALLDDGYKVNVFDTYWYGDVLKKHINLTETKGDIRNHKLVLKSSENIDAIIHLACISNDPSFDLNPDLAESINYKAFFNILNSAKVNKVKRFIFASSSSVYGVKKEKNVTERSIPEPITDYSKYKWLCEQELHKVDDMEWVIARPATVCGYSPRLRLDVVVNILTANAIENGKIKVFGTGENLRPNININDMVRVYQTLLNSESGKINKETFNTGYQNMSILDIADTVIKVIGEDKVELELVTENKDDRSYHINSDKIKNRLGFNVKYTVEDAILSIIDAYKEGKIANDLQNSIYHNIKRMKELGIV